MTTWIWAAGAAVAGDDLDAALAACATGALHPLPDLTIDQRRRLVDGEVVRTVDRRGEDEPSAAVGLAILRAPREALWIASQDPHTQVDPGLTEFIVEHLGADHALWYGHLDLPRPLKDRQWVVASTNNHDMATATADACWEHSWVLVEDGIARVRPMVEASEPKGITTDHLDSAIFTPVNRGSWFMAPLSDGRVLVAYQASSVVAGFIPDWLVTQLAMGRLEDLMRNLEKRALNWSTGHYQAGHSPVYAGDGAPLPRYP